MSRDVFKYLIYMNDIIEMNSEEKYEGNIRILQASGISEFLLFQIKGGLYSAFPGLYMVRIRTN